MIFAARQLQEKCQDQNVNLYTYVDLTKAFDTVSRDGLWKMDKFGCPEKSILMVHQFHEGMQAHVQDNGTFTSLSQSPMVLNRTVCLPQLYSASCTQLCRPMPLGW